MRPACCQRRVTGPPAARSATKKPTAVSCCSPGASGPVGEDVPGSRRDAARPEPELQVVGGELARPGAVVAQAQQQVHLGEPVDGDVEAARRLDRGRVRGVAQQHVRAGHLQRDAAEGRGGARPGLHRRARRGHRDGPAAGGRPGAPGEGDPEREQRPQPGGAHVRATGR